ncbi:PREDICTED: uncharacterized protein C4orf26 homolog [Elephantulus edwardii]|uniref:uncharacterized protein C4orf26 homolog n=1 Tax=Elephantulus edwardii TaxID=28737 RepID=UPI0003F081E2|nr:PREDICTED: uncharacterized protein C4orf26 homolog [Elephantulus edwardii]
MSYRRYFSWFLICCLVVNVAEGQEGAVTPHGGSQNDVDHTNCEIFTLTPPPTTRKPVTRVQLIPWTPRYFPRRYLRRGSSSEES